ncbi:hypothetical protein B2A_00418, partial [mine drainage metagenome]
MVLNMTVTATTKSSFLTVYPGGQSRPMASDLNWAPGATVANLVVVEVGSSGMITAYNNGGSAQVIADVEGYYG